MVRQLPCGTTRGHQKQAENFATFLLTSPPTFPGTPWPSSWRRRFQIFGTSFTHRCDNAVHCRQLSSFRAHRCSANSYLLHSPTTTSVTPMIFIIVVTSAAVLQVNKVGCCSDKEQTGLGSHYDTGASGCGLLQTHTAILPP